MNAKQLYFKQLKITSPEGIEFLSSKVYYCSTFRLTYLEVDHAETCCRIEEKGNDIAEMVKIHEI